MTELVCLKCQIGRIEFCQHSHRANLSDEYSVRFGQGVVCIAHYQTLRRPCNTNESSVD